MSFWDSIQSSFGSARYAVTSHSSEIMVVSGIVSVIAGTAMLIKNSTRVADILEERRDSLQKLKELQEEDPDYSEEMLRQDGKKINLVSGIGLAKTEGPGIGLVLGGLLLTAGGFASKSSECNAWMSFGTTTAGLLTAYRQKAKEIYGEEADDRIMYGLEKRKVETVVDVNEETGEVKTKKEEMLVADNPFGVSPYAIWFDKDTCPDEWDENMDVNIGFLNGCQGMLHDRFQYDNYDINLNEAYKMIGYKYLTKQGNDAGWSHKSKNGDGQILLRIIPAAREDYPGADTYHQALIVDFNVDGAISHFFKSHNFSKEYALEAKMTRE